MRIKSPGYPNINLSQAIDSTKKLFAKNRRNMIDREAATKDIGYSGLTGASTKMLSNLSHFGLIEKAGKGGVRVTQLAAQAIHPRTPEEGKAALREAAYSPALYAAINEQWPDGAVSDNALRGYLAREGFASAAINGAISSYMETYQFLQQENATESHSALVQPADNAAREQLVEVPEAYPTGISGAGQRYQPAPPPQQRETGVQITAGERELTTGLLSKGAGFRLIVHGKIGEKEIDRLIRKLQLDKEILADNDEVENPDED